VPLLQGHLGDARLSDNSGVALLSIQCSKRDRDAASASQREGDRRPANGQWPPSPLVGKWSTIDIK
jgi:hypothetical protein